MNSFVIKGKSDYCKWIYELLTEYGIGVDLEENGCNKLYCGDVEIDLDYLYNIDFYPRLMNVYEKLGSNYEDAEGMVLGLSYGRDSIDCTRMSKKFIMLANSAQDLFYDKCCMEHYIDRLPNLKYVIQNFSPYSLRYDESLSHSKRDNVLFYYTMYGTYHNYKGIEGEIQKYNYEKSKFDNMFSGIIDWRSLRRSLWSTYFECSGWVDPSLERKSFDPNNIPKEEIATTRAQYNKPYPKTIAENSVIVTQMFEKLTTRNVKIIMYFQPINQFYKKYWDKTYYEEALDFAKLMEKKYNCTVLDMTNISIPIEYYLDMGHPNYLGKEYITRIVDDHIMNL